MAQAQDEVRKALAARLRRPIDEEIWALLVEDRYVAEAAQSDSLDDLANRYQRLVRLRGKKPSAPRPGPREIPPDARLRALSWRLAQLAAERPNVQAFRERVLGGKLLNYGDIAEWVKRTAEADGQVQPQLIVTVPPGYTVTDIQPSGSWTVPPLTISEAMPAVQAPMRLLAYSTRGKGAVMRTHVAVGGILDELRQLSQALAGEFGWQEALATTFVLTGLAPEMPKALISFEWHFGATAETRIHIAADASTPVREVAEAYRQARADLARSTRSRRYRRMEEKHSQLARLYSENGRPWRERMSAWNKQHPQWKYTEVRNFSRDCTRAWRRLFGEQEI